MLEASCARERSRGPCPAPLSLPRDPPSCCRGVQLEVEVASGAALVNCSRTITALLECGDLSPLWPGRQNESGDKSPHSISDSLFVLLLRIPRHNYTPSRRLVSVRTTLEAIYSSVFFGWWAPKGSRRNK